MPSAAGVPRVLDPMLGDDACFGGGQMVDEDAAIGRVPAEELDVAVEYRLSAEIDRTQVR